MLQCRRLSILGRSRNLVLFITLSFCSITSVLTVTSTDPLFRGSTAGYRVARKNSESSKARVSTQLLRGLHQSRERSLSDSKKDELAAKYLDALLADPAAARNKLCGDFTKRSKTLVVYMCYERMEMIHRALPAVLRSEGLRDFDFLISQDGGSPPILDKDINVVGFFMPRDQPYMYIHHEANLCTGLHHYFVKAFAFDIMGYDTLLVVEEDNVIHPQALQLLARMVELSVSEPTIGLVSLLDMDMSPFLDESRFSVGIIPTDGLTGHLWVFGVHRSKYEPVKGLLRAYYDVIKGHDYSKKYAPPLKDAIEALMKQEGFPQTIELSQDRWFINSLAKHGFVKRYQTLYRFYEPIGHYGLHWHLNASDFYGVFGHHMYSGRIEPAKAFDITKDPANMDIIKAVIRQRVGAMHQKYRGNAPFPEKRLGGVFEGLMAGRLNGLAAVRDFTGLGGRR